MSGFAYSVSNGQVNEVPLKQAPGQQAELLWVHLTVGNEEAQHWLGGEAKLPDYVIDALTAAETRPRCDAMGPGAFINLRGPSPDPELDELASVRIYAQAGTVYSVTRRPLNALDEVRKLVVGGMVADPGDLIAEFAMAITAELDPIVAQLGDDLDACESELEATRAFELRRQVTRTRIEAIGYRRFLVPQRSALEKLATLPCDWLHDDDRQHLVTAADRAARMAEEVEAIRERAGLMHETLTDLRGELIDQRSLIIAIAAMIFLPLTFITGLYGMNVEGLPYAHEPWAFDAIMALCTIIGVGITVYFVRQHWTR
ncbi:zinc transporter ZntB [Sphingomonas cannabina]|uniref:zinc transporter ZntB n=1 Tax=Sphingomonas cannabina TaxID=2899123 RepID=UPI001F179993|nr:zinc transporter ZntB [Sphingomonas cannabina]UIJ45422.1 zinc transporter ZntB [Sphingomonas cannabina]